MNISPYVRKIHYYETDQMGIVHHSNYIRWFEETRLDYLEQVDFNYEKAVAANIDFAVLGVSCEYKSMLRFGDTVRIDMRVSDLAAMRMTLTYSVVHEKTGVLCAVGESKHCYYHNRKKRPVSLVRELPELYALFEAALS